MRETRFGTRMSAGQDWSFGRIPLPFLMCGERHALWQKSAIQSLSYYYITPSEHVMSPRIHELETLIIIDN